VSGNFSLILAILTKSYRLDFNDVLGGVSFTGTKDWRTMMPEWSKYANESFGESGSLYCPTDHSSHHSSAGRLQAPTMMAMKISIMTPSRSPRREPKIHLSFWK
jgi:hypothetical protein